MLANTQSENNSPQAAFDIEKLLDRNAFQHEVTQLELIETHISWVILTGPFAYKIKKPVKFDFVDYSNLELRRRFCERELELNGRFAPEIYLEVVPIVEVNGRLVASPNSAGLESQPVAAPGAQQAIGYAVKMVQFPQEDIAATRLAGDKLTAAMIERFGQDLAKFHDSIECANPTISCVQVPRIGNDAMDNFLSLQEGFQSQTTDNDFDQKTRRLVLLGELEKWTADQFESLQPHFAQRLKNGFVRLCHGDMHLKNVVQRQGRLIPFDGIEFNPEFQWIDVLSETAFPVMDLVARGRTDLAWRLLNAYLESSGDYAGLSVMRFYLVYRALVRAKVTWLNPKNHPPELPARQVASNDPLAGPWDKYLETARYFAFGLNSRLVITHGFSGSGKSMFALQVVEEHGGVRIRSDVERQRLVEKFKKTDKYSPEMSDWVYSRLLELAYTAIDSGIPAVIDATFLKHKYRSIFQKLASELHAEFEILDCDAPFEELCQRIRNRGSDPSEATIGILELQMETHDPLTTDERQFIRKIDSRPR